MIVEVIDSDPPSFGHSITGYDCPKCGISITSNSLAEALQIGHSHFEWDEELTETERNCGLKIKPQDLTPCDKCPYHVCKIMRKCDGNIYFENYCSVEICNKISLDTIQ